MTFDVSFRKQKMQVKSETPLPGSPAVNPELVRYSQKEISRSTLVQFSGKDNGSAVQL
jgi:hypothetical protein